VQQGSMSMERDGLTCTRCVAGDGSRTSAAMRTYLRCQHCQEHAGAGIASVKQAAASAWYQPYCLTRHSTLRLSVMGCRWHSATWHTHILAPGWPGRCCVGFTGSHRCRKQTAPVLGLLPQPPAGFIPACLKVRQTVRSTWGPSSPPAPAQSG
jgi:hypothetical protein